MQSAADAAGCRRLQGSVAVVAGAATGIGRASALRLAGEGARLVVGSPSGEADLLDSLTEEILASGGEALACPFDATDETSVKRLIDTAVDHFGRIDTVHANFADLRVILEDSDAICVSDDVLERTLDVDLKGMVRITRHAVPALLARGGGALVFTSSIAAIMGDASRPCYAMAKAGVNALVRHCASKWGREGLRANAVMPGYVRVPEKSKPALSPLEERALAEGRSLRLGKPEDIAAMVALLASSDGEWINGQCIAVDGGSTLS